MVLVATLLAPADAAARRKDIEERLKEIDSRSFRKELEEAEAAVQTKDVSVCAAAVMHCCACFCVPPTLSVACAAALASVCRLPCWSGSTAGPRPRRSCSCCARTPRLSGPS